MQPMIKGHNKIWIETQKLEDKVHYKYWENYTAVLWNSVQHDTETTILNTKNFVTTTLDEIFNDDET